MSLRAVSLTILNNFPYSLFVILPLIRRYSSGFLLSFIQIKFNSINHSLNIRISKSYNKPTHSLFKFWRRKFPFFQILPDAQETCSSLIRNFRIIEHTCNNFVSGFRRIVIVFDIINCKRSQ